MHRRCASCSVSPLWHSDRNDPTARSDPLSRRIWRAADFRYSNLRSTVLENTLDHSLCQSLVGCSGPDHLSYAYSIKHVFYIFFVVNLHAQVVTLSRACIVRVRKKRFFFCLFFSKKIAVYTLSQYGNVDGCTTCISTSPLPRCSKWVQGTIFTSRELHNRRLKEYCCRTVWKASTLSFVTTSTYLRAFLAEGVSHTVTERPLREGQEDAKLQGVKV